MDSIIQINNNLEEFSLETSNNELAVGVTGSFLMSKVLGECNV